MPDCDGRLLVVTGRPVMMTDATVDGMAKRIAKTRSILIAPNYSRCLPRAAFLLALRMRSSERDFIFLSPDLSHFLRLIVFLL